MGYGLVFQVVVAAVVGRKQLFWKETHLPKNLIP
jgi:hypothetical protein